MSMGTNATQVQSILESLFLSAIQKMTTEGKGNFISDIYVQADPETGEVFMRPYKYFINLVEMPAVLAVLLVGVVGVLFGIGKSIYVRTWNQGIWFAGAGTVLTVLALLLCAGWNDTAYYPSLVDLQSSLTIQNSCSSPFTLKVMSFVSILIPFVVAYIFYAWRVIDLR